MRLKILVLFSAIVLGIGAAISVLLIMHLGDSKRPEAELQSSARRAVQLARLQWQADELRREAWLASYADAPWVKAVFSLGTGQARGDAATDAANRLLDSSRVAGDQSAAADRSALPTLSLFVGADGIAIGRNSVALMRGDPIAARHPEQWQKVQGGLAASAVWFSRERQEQWFVSMVPIKGDAGEWLGAVALGVPLSDEALSRVSMLTLDLPLWAVALDEGGARLLSRTRSNLELPLDPSTVTWLSGVVASGPSEAAPTLRALAPNSMLAAQQFDPRAEGLVLVTLARTSGPLTPERLLWSVWAVIGVGLLMVGASAVLLGAYYSRPIGEIEEGLLQLINGERELRFDPDHPELGAIAARINLLLDSVFGGKRDVSDDPGEPLADPDVAAR